MKTILSAVVFCFAFSLCVYSEKSQAALPSKSENKVGGKKDLQKNLGKNFQKSVLEQKVDPKKSDGKSATREEKTVYREVAVAYEQNDFAAFQEQMILFKKDYPTSIFMDDVHYMLGMMHAGRKEYGQALKTFNEALTKFPSSNRLRTLMLSKGTTLKRMNLHELAENLFQQVKKKFPGSPEALRAEMELKLIQQ